MQRAAAGYRYSHIHIRLHTVHSFIHSIKISVTQNWVSLSSSARFFIAESTAIEKEKAARQRARHGRRHGMKEEAGHREECWQRRQQAKTVLLLLQNTIQLFMELEEFDPSRLSLWILKTRNWQWGLPGWTAWYSCVFSGKPSRGPRTNTASRLWSWPWSRATDR